MSTNDSERSPGTGPGMFDHLIPRGPDPRTPEERAADEQRERNRRAGRRRKNWWLDDANKDPSPAP